eukprot:gene24033-30329_t
MFAVSREHIHQHDIEYYRSLLKSLETHANPEDGHFIERSWVAVFHPIPEHCLYAAKPVHAHTSSDSTSITTSSGSGSLVTITKADKAVAKVLNSKQSISRDRINSDCVRSGDSEESNRRSHGDDSRQNYNSDAQYKHYSSNSHTNYRNSDKKYSDNNRNSSGYHRRDEGGGRDDERRRGRSPDNRHSHSHRDRSRDREADRNSYVRSRY